MRYGLASLVGSLVALIAVIGSGCGGYYYKVVKQEPLDAPALASAAAFKWRPVDFSAIERLEDYENDEAWMTEVRDVQKEYLEVVNERINDEGLEGKVATVGLKDPVTEGVVIEPKVKRIKREFSGATGGYDFLYIDLVFKDAATQKVLFQSELECTSHHAFGPTRWRQQSLNGRLAFATWNSIGPIVSIIKNQKIAPLQD